MPGPVTDNWQAVQDTAVALGSITRAAHQHGVSVAAACQRAKRESWPVGQRPSKTLAAAREAAAVQIERNGGVRSVTTAVAVTDELSEDNRASRLALSRGLRRDAEHYARLTGEEGLEKAEKVGALVRSTAQVHRWEGQAAPVFTLNLLQYGGAMQCGTAVEQASTQDHGESA